MLLTNHWHLRNGSDVHVHAIDCARVSVYCSSHYLETTYVSECDEGSYGVNCAETCGHCSGLCDRVDGDCEGGCQQWYGLSRCKTEIGKYSDCVRFVNREIVKMSTLSFQAPKYHRNVYIHYSCLQLAAHNARQRLSSNSHIICVPRFKTHNTFDICMFL